MLTDVKIQVTVCSSLPNLQNLSKHQSHATVNYKDHCQIKKTMALKYSFQIQRNNITESSYCALMFEFGVIN